MKSHPLAEIFPPMSEADYASLKTSIESHGQLDPIVLLDAMVLDGRHRARACRELGLTPITETYDGDNPRAFVLAKNLSRRHLDESQRAMVAARLATLKHGQKKADVENPTSSVSQSEAASLLNVDRTSVIAARKVLQDGAPELVAAVDRGEIKVSAAKAIAGLDDRDQKEIALTKDPQARKEKIQTAKARAKTQQAHRREAAPLTLVASKAVTSPAERHYSIEDWKHLDKSQRRDIIDAGFECKSKMNDQPGDSIEWARRSLNTVTGCLHDCVYCYARDIANRLYPQKFAPTFHPARLSAPSNEALPAEAKNDPAYRNVFANSMSDLFGQWVPREWIEATIDMARRNADWNFLTLTKFPQRAAEFEFPENWWMGTTVDAQSRVANAERAFEKVRCGTKWLSVEPLLQPLKFSRLDLFQWIVIGGASASQKTPAWVPSMDWIAELHVAARAAGLRIYYKTNCDMGSGLRMREFPWSQPRETSLPKSLRYIKGL